MQALLLGLLVAVAAVTSAAAPTVELTDGSLRFESSVAARTFAQGIPVPISLSVRNSGAAPVGVTFASGQRYDFIVRRPRGDEVWRWSHDKAFIQIVRTVSLKPGEELAFRVTWDQRDLQGRQVDPGTYEIVAAFLGRAGGSTRAPRSLPPLSIEIIK